MTNEMNDKQASLPPAASASVWQVFVTFLKLGLTSFGGPVAHVGYFKQTLVDQYHWLSANQFAQLLAICQFLPGPTSSQLGFGLGLLRAGWLGAIAASLAFTLPSAILLIAFAVFLPYFSGSLGEAIIHGLKILAFAVVAQAVLSMLRALCPDKQRIIIATIACVMVLLVNTIAVQLIVIIGGAVAGLFFCRHIQIKADDQLAVFYSPRLGIIILTLFALLLIGLPLLAAINPQAFSIADIFYRAGALVFGGGHVVLPWLETAMVDHGLMSSDQFLAGYGASQAVPGPMFAFSAYLGWLLSPESNSLGFAIIALISIFLPGFLLLIGVLPLWQKISQSAKAAQAIAGMNAVVVGLLGAALYDPIFTSAILNASDLAIGLIAFVLLTSLRLSMLSVIAWCVLAKTAMVFL